MKQPATRAELNTTATHRMTHDQGGLALNADYLDTPEVTIIHRVNQPGFDEPRVSEGDLLVADRRVKPCDGSLVIAMIEGKQVVRLFSVSCGRQYLRSGDVTSCALEVAGDIQMELLATVVSVIPVIEDL